MHTIYILPTQLSSPEEVYAEAHGEVDDAVLAATLREYFVEVLLRARADVRGKGLKGEGEAKGQ